MKSNKELCKTIENFCIFYQKYKSSNGKSMNKKQKIKVIKKRDAIIAQTSLIKEKISEKMTNRDMSSTVSEWVKEFQQRRYEEATLSFEQLPASI